MEKINNIIAKKFKTFTDYLNSIGKKNLEEDDLRECFKECIEFAQKESSQPDIVIYFKFSSYDDYKFEPVKLTIFGGIEFNGVYFDLCHGKTQLKDVYYNIICDNMRYNHFAFMDYHIIRGNSQCHGHGEYWGTDTFVFRFHRFQE